MKLFFIKNKGFSRVLKQKLTIINELGLHARPAALIAKTARKAKSEIWIEKDDTRVDATSMIDILSIACQKGSLITLIADSIDDKKIFDEIKDIILNGFGE
ncbi:MAG: HPr family phosphocarrier protein [Desulforegulaceae bacterium]|nr:HPr family phosphocarrier protein [Desulforegulaceae bacterium]